SYALHSSMVVAPLKDPTTDLIDHSIRALLSAPRDRAIHLSLRFANGAFTTSVRAVDEDEILEQAKNRGVVDLVKRSRDVKKVRDACDVARQFYFEVATRQIGGERGFDAILRREMRRRREGRKIVIEEKESWIAWVSRRIRGVTSRSNP
ncbi:hypothetical protein PENTCL1PPCAC_27782, partial [Pristionchus entomophagus]